MKDPTLLGYPNGKFFSWVDENASAQDNIRYSAWVENINDKVSGAITSEILIAYSIFSLYRNTKTIHSIMMIWQNNFIESNYKLASGPPKDPGGVKNIFSRSRGH